MLGPLCHLRTPSRPLPRPALFLDRDGVLNRRVIDGYVTKEADVDLIDVALDAAATAQELGVALVVVSNQGSIGRGLASESDVMAVNTRLLELLNEAKIDLDGIYVCPHHPEAVDPADRRCSCRKPKPGLIHAAVSDLNIDLATSVMIGDQPTDISAAIAAGISPDCALLVHANAEAHLPARVLKLWDTV